MSLTDKEKEALAAEVKSMVSESFRTHTNRLVTEAEAEITGFDPLLEGEEHDEEDEGHDEEELDEEESSDEDDDEEEEEEEVKEAKGKKAKYAKKPKAGGDVISESMKVVATKSGSRNNDKPEQMTIKRHQELVRLAKSGKYEYFTVEKKDGTMVEYSVENRKLIEM